MNEPRSYDPNCIFCKIARGQIPAKKIYEDAEVMAFHDIRPQAPVHLLIIPKEHVATLYDAQPAHQAAFGKMLGLAGRLAREAGAGDGFRAIINNGRVGHQEVYHVHMHVLGGPDPLGPMLSRRT
jgi:histidine triad (HIT) family protein